MSTSSDPFRKSFRRTLKLGTKRDKEKTCKQELLITDTEVSCEEKKEGREEEDVAELAEIEEMYTLPEIPHTPLSGIVSPTGF